MQKKNSALILISVGVLSLLFALLNLNGPIRAILALFSLLFIPGFFIIMLFPNVLRLEDFEIIPISIGISMAIITIIATYLNYTPFHITPASSIGTVLFLSLVAYLFHLKYDFSELEQVSLKDKKEKLIENKRNAFKLIIVGVIAFIIPLAQVLRWEYYIGWDPWVITPFVREILENNWTPLSPFPYPYISSFSGYYYFIALLHNTTNISVYHLTRFGGPIVLSITSSIIFITMYRIFKSDWVLLIPFFFFTNPFLIKRFMMPLRENFTFIFLVLLFFMLATIYSNWSEKKYGTVLISSILFSAILLSHFLVFVISFFTIVFTLFYFILKSIATKEKEWENLKYFTIIPLGGLIIGAPSIKILYKIINWQLINQTLSLNAFLILLIFLSVIYILRTQQYTKMKFYWIPALFACFLVVGAFYSILNPLGTGGKITGQYNPPITMSDFSIIELLLSPIGILWVIKNNHKEQIKAMFFISAFSLAILALLNTPIIGLKSVLFRLNIYISLAIAVFSGIGLWNIIEYFNKIIKSQTVRRITLPLLLMFIIFFNISTAIEVTASSNFDHRNMELVDELEAMKSVHDGIVIPQKRCDLLLYYMNVRDVDITLAKDVFTASSSESIKRAIKSKYPSVDRAYIIMFFKDTANPAVNYENSLLLRLPEIVEKENWVDRPGGYIFIVDLNNSDIQ